MTYGLKKRSKIDLSYILTLESYKNLSIKSYQKKSCVKLHICFCQGGNVHDHIFLIKQILESTAIFLQRKSDKAGKKKSNNQKKMHTFETKSVKRKCKKKEKRNSKCVCIERHQYIVLKHANQFHLCINQDTCRCAISSLCMLVCTFIVIITDYSFV